jgi:hypothetical protein
MNHLVIALFKLSVYINIFDIQDAKMHENFTTIWSPGLKVEAEPFQENEQGKINFETWAPDGSEIFMHLCVLYIKYIDIYRKLEECYD